MRVYLASRYSRRAELNGYRAELEAMGYKVISRWLWEDHEIPASVDEAGKLELSCRYAEEDWADLMAADIVIVFTQDPQVSKNGRNRGGLHVEFGAALAAKKRVILCGPRVNVFHTLQSVEHYPGWVGVRAALWRVGCRIRRERRCRSCADNIACDAERGRLCDQLEVTS